MTVAAAPGWERFFGHARYVRENPRFESEGRQRNLAAAAAMRAVIAAARAGSPLLPKLESLFRETGHPAAPYLLTLRRQNEWLRRWADSDEPALAAALTRAGAAGRGERFDLFAAEVEQAYASGVPKQPRAALVFASLIDFALDEKSSPVIRPNVFERVRRLLGLPPEPPGTLHDEYRAHAAFARLLQEELRAAGIELVDMAATLAVVYTVAAPDFPHSRASPSPATDGSAVRTGLHSKAPGQAYLAVSASIGFEAQYLEEWIEHHRLAGVERFFLYNNQDRAAQKEVLARYSRDGVVTLYDFPVFPPQQAAVEHTLREHAHDARWIAFIDADEFLVSVEALPLPEVLAEYEPYPGIGVMVALFGSGGHETKPAGPVTEAYTVSVGSRHIKSIVDPGAVARYGSPHHFVYRAGHAVDENRYPIVGGRTTFCSMSRLRVNHYYTKSIEERREKWERRRADTGELREDAFFERAVANEALFGEHDDAIVRYARQLRTRLSAS